MKRRRVTSNPKREFWIAMREMQRRLEEIREHAERERAEARERERERARLQAERDQQRERQWEKSRAEADARLGRAEQMFTGHWGKLVESLVEGDLARLLRERGVEVVVVASRVELVLDPRRREIDLLAANGEEVVAVEVKTTMKVADVRRFVELLEEVRELLPIALRRMRIYGGMAYLRAEEEAARYAERQGLYVIRATGNSASIINAPGFRPRAFDPETPATDA